MAVALSGCGGRLPTVTDQPQGVAADDWESAPGRLSTVDGTWTTRLGGNDRAGDAPAVGRLDAGWQVGCGNLFADPPAAPLVVAGRVVQPRSRSIRTFDATTGTHQWTTEFRAGRTLTGSPTAAGGQLYATVGSQLVACAVGSGDIRRLAVGTAFRTEPLVHDGRVVVGTDEPALLVFDTDGTRLARVRLGGSPVELAASTATIFVRTTRGLARVNTADWGVEWHRELPARPRAGAVPLVTADGVIVPTGRGNVRAFDRGGSVRWQTNLASDAVFSPVTAGGRTYVTDQTGRLFACTAGTVERRIEPPAGTAPSGLAAIEVDRSPVVAGSRVLCPGANGELLSVSTESDRSQPTALARFPSRVAAPPTVVSGAVFVNALPTTFGLST